MLAIYNTPQKPRTSACKASKIIHVNEASFENMEFCSPKVLLYESSDEEYLSANEMLEGITPRSGTRHDRRWSYCKIRTLFNP